MNLNYINLGTAPYGNAYTLQLDLLKKVQYGASDTLLLLEHPRVITLGINAKEYNILIDEQLLIQRGFSIERIRRGGDVTYHGPGQIVGYTIFNLKKNHGGSIKTFVFKLEQLIIDLLHEEFTISAHRDAINAGVFVGLDKICAIGLSVHSGVTMHGFALNVNTQLEDFETIVPCGLANRGVTSIENINGVQQDIEAVKASIYNRFIQVFYSKV